jgi:solute carrier family 25 (mitochondrial carnitine/acylcarnitine transporter), member 20/29
MQLHPKDPRYKTFSHTVINVNKQGGIASTSRGTVVTIYRDVPGNAAYFATYKYIKQLCTNYNYNNTNSNGHSIINQKQMMMLLPAFAGGMAGVANWTVAIPIDVVKSQWQVSEPGQYRNVQAIVHQLYQTHSIRAFFTGLSPAFLRTFPANAACFLAADTVKCSFSFYNVSHG